LLRRGGDEQRLVDGVLVLDAEDRHALEPQPLVHGDGRGGVMHDRQIDELPAALEQVVDQVADQRGADAGTGRLPIGRQRPDARSVLRSLNARRWSAAAAVPRIWPVARSSATTNRTASLTHDSAMNEGS